MSFEAREQSAREGEPIEFVKIYFEDGSLSYLYNSTTMPVTYQSQVYLPAAIERGEISKSSASEDSTLRLLLPRKLPVIESFKISPPHKRILIAYFRQHLNDSEVRPVFQGFLSGIRVRDDAIELSTQSFEALLERASPRDMWQGSCRFYLYDGEKKDGRGCPVPSIQFRHSGVIGTHNGDTITATALGAQSNGYFALGFVEHVSTGQRSMIVEHNGQTARLLAPFGGSLVGENVYLFAGCDGAKSTCAGKFSAHTRAGRDFGGLDRVPQYNPSKEGIR